MRYTPGLKSEKASDTYTRAEIRRILGINENRLRSWERRGLAQARETYEFSDLASLRTLQKLRESKIPNNRIVEALGRLRKSNLAGVDSPIGEIRIVSEGRRVVVRLPGEKIEAITGQLLFDFDADGPRPLTTLEPPQAIEPPVAATGDEDHWFRQAQDLEDAGAPIDQVIEAYRKVVECNPQAAGAWVNMGTLQFRQGLLQVAESSYLEALQAYPDYAVAHYNLGNVYDVTDRQEEAILHYREALRLDPDYLDAHFNIALVYGQQRRLSDAIRHWNSYLSRDPSSPWAQAARRNRDQLLGMASDEGLVAGGTFRKPVRERVD